MADLDLSAKHFGDELAVLQAQLNSAKGANPAVDYAGLEDAIEALTTKHAKLLNEAHTANVDKPQPSNNPLGPFVRATDPPPVVPFSTPENTPRITAQNVSIPARPNDPTDYPFPNKAADLPTPADQTTTRNTIVTTAPNSTPEEPS